MVTVATKIEHIEEIADGRAVERHIRIIFTRDRIRQIVSAARCQRLEPPIALDEFQDRDMVVIGVRHVRRREAVLPERQRFGRRLKLSHIRKSWG
jgi:hypothetical protein